MLLRNPFVLIFILVTLLSCSKIESENLSQVVNLTFNAKYQNSTSELPTDKDREATTSIVYVCENLTVKQIYKGTAANLGTFVLHEGLLNSSSRLYSISNYHLIPGAESIAIGESQAIIEAFSFTQATMPQELIMSAVTDITQVANRQIDVNMVRSVARFDIGVKGTGVEIHSMSVSGLAQKGSVFPGVTLADNTYAAKFEAVYPTPITSDTKGVFYAYELPVGKQALLVAKVSYNGVFATLKIPITQIRRNYLYKIAFSAIGSMVTADIDLSGMEEGSIGDAEANRISIKIDPTNSTIPLGVEIGNENQRLTLPYAGATATIALAGDFDKQYTIDGTIDGLVITPEAGTVYQNSKLRITVPANKRMGGNNQAALISVGRKGETDQTKFDRIAIVAENFAPFEIVTMGGIDWMAINNISANPNDYPVLEAGQTMRQLYGKNWMKYSSKNIQWGPRPGRGTSGYVWWAAWEYTSFLYTDLPSINGDIIGGDACMVWEEKNTFCPKGWRVAEGSEFAKIWPPIDHDFGVNASVSYSTSAGNFKATYEKFGNRDDAYNLVISDGANELILPIAGWREDDGVRGGKYDYLGTKIGVSVYYWCRTREQGRGSMAYSIVDRKSYYAGENHKHWMSVRCVRDTE